ncbi:hypothetical protein ACHAWF_003938 [Thalassiosira exigua]
MMADLSPPSSVLVGVDISSQRISLCKNIVKKYHIDEASSAPKSMLKSRSASDAKEIQTSTSHTTIQLYCADGTTFGMKEARNENRALVFDSNAAMEELMSRGKRKRMNKSARAREKRRLLELQQEHDNANATKTDADDAERIDCKGSGEKSKEADEKNPATPGRVDQLCGDSENTLAVSLFDRVLVDAECSTDGATRHIERRLSPSMPMRNVAWDDSNMDELVELQRGLIESGFRLLKPGGLMVYSTCSLSTRQNEEVVLWLLEKYKNASIIPVSFHAHRAPNVKDFAFVKQGPVCGTVRFDPRSHCAEGHSSLDNSLPGTGFFLAKITKMV